MKHLEAGGSLPPIHVTKFASGAYRVLDGRHRIAAHKLLGRKTILARYGVSKTLLTAV